MLSTRGRTCRVPTAQEASAALDAADAAKARLAHRLALPPHFWSSIAVAIAVQLATSAVGISQQSAGGTATLAAALAAAFSEAWWLVGVASGLGGAGYARCGHRWLRAYRGAPEVHGRPESASWLALLAAAALIDLALLLLGR